MENFLLNRVKSTALILINLVISTALPALPKATISADAFIFNARAVVGGEIRDFSLKEYDGKYKILLFYPADFSFICPTELFAFQEKLADFEALNTAVVAISVDQVYSHFAWINQPRNQGGIKGITYPLVSDVTKVISRTYGVLDEAQGVALRGLVIVDKDNKIQYIAINNLNVGRDVNEALRVLKGVQFTQEHGDVCPANWQEGKETMAPTHEGLVHYLEKQKK